MFPCPSLFSFPPTTSTTVTLLSKTVNEKKLTNAVLRDLNSTYIQQFGHTFVDSLVKNCRDVDKKKTKSEKKREHRNILKKVGIRSTSNWQRMLHYIPLLRMSH